MDLRYYMQMALNLADDASARDEVPVGAVIVRDDQILGEGFNRNISDHDPTAHAEISALREACKYVGNYRIPGSTIFVTIEPCPMCYAALVQARIAHVVFGADDLKGGFRQFYTSSHEAFNHRVIITPGVMGTEASDKIKNFFREKRERGKRKWMPTK